MPRPRRDGASLDEAAFADSCARAEIKIILAEMTRTKRQIDDFLAAACARPSSRRRIIRSTRRRGRCRPWWNAASPSWPSGLSAARFMRTPIRRGRSGCCARRERPRGCRAAEQCDEGAAVHSITSSAATISLCGTVSSSDLAVLRLMINSNFVGCWTGSSAGLVPRKIRSAYDAACRIRSR